MDEQEYNRIKDEYKEHFRKMRDLKKRVGEVERKKHLGEALQSLDTSAMMDSFSHLVDQVKERAAVSQAKIELMLEQDDANNDYRNEDELRKEEARKLIHDLKQATSHPQEKSQKPEQTAEESNDDEKTERDSSESASSEIKKTIGPRK